MALEKLAVVGGVLPGSLLRTGTAHTPTWAPVSRFAVSVAKPAVLPGTKALSAVSAQAAATQKNKLKEPGGGSFR